MSDTEAELKTLIIETLALEDVTPADIEPEAALFVEGLGLDSIDALELSMVLEERYGVHIGDDPDALPVLSGQLVVDEPGWNIDASFDATYCTVANGGIPCD